MQARFVACGTCHRGNGRPTRGGRLLRFLHHDILVVALLLLGLASQQVVIPHQAYAGSREKHLISITKTTIYGALLGGILGLCGALVVKSGYEDDSIRWGVAVGALSGFVYGALSSDESDDFSQDLTRTAIPGIQAGFRRRLLPCGPTGPTCVANPPDSSGESIRVVGAPFSLEAWGTDGGASPVSDLAGLRIAREEE